jgi:chromosome partitioning protein
MARKKKIVKRPPISISIGCRKGGVGKSALCATLASHFAHQGRSVLIVDLDPQGNVTFGLGGEPGAIGSAELLKGDAVEPIELHENIFILPGGPELNSVEVSGLDPEGLEDALKERELSYDVTLFDLPPYSEHLERLGLVASRLALIPVVAHPFAISGAARIIELIEARKKRARPGPDRYALVQSMTDLRRSLDRSLNESLNELFPGTAIFNFRQDIAVAYSLTEQIPLHEYDRRARVIPEIERIGGWLDG